MELSSYSSSKDIYKDSNLTDQERHELSDCAYEIDRLLKAKFGNTDWKKLKGLKILEIGCGSHNERSSETNYRPYLVMLAGACGAKVTGIDIYPSSPDFTKYYTHIEANVVPIVMSHGIDKFDQLDREKFDVVIVRRFLSGGFISMDPTLRSMIMIAKVEEPEFRQKLKEQATRLLKRSGLLVFEDEFLRQTS